MLNVFQDEILLSGSDERAASGTLLRRRRRTKVEGEILQFGEETV